MPPASPEVAAAPQPFLDEYKLAGAIGIVADRTGKVHYRNLMGYADVEAKTPISEDNVFWIASMSKMFAGASIMMLVDEGKVRLDDPVTKFIPQLGKWMVAADKDREHVVLKRPARPVTIRHLLCHTSGLAGASELQLITGSDSTPLRARALASVTGPLRAQPGSKYAYGNQGMNIAARVLEVVSVMPYEQFLQKRFFDPLGMAETTFWPSKGQVERLAGAYGPNKDRTGYARGGIGFLTEPLSDRVRRHPAAGGGLFSTPHDILRYGLMLANDGELDGGRYLSHAAGEGADGGNQGELQPGLSSPQRHVRPRRGLRDRPVRRPEDGDGGRLHGAMHRWRPVGRPRSVPQGGQAGLSEMTPRTARDGHEDRPRGLRPSARPVEPSILRNSCIDRNRNDGRPRKSPGTTASRAGPALPGRIPPHSVVTCHARRRATSAAQPRASRDACCRPDTRATSCREAAHVARD